MKSKLFILIILFILVMALISNCNNEIHQNSSTTSTINFTYWDDVITFNTDIYPLSKCSNLAIDSSGNIYCGFIDSITGRLKVFKWSNNTITQIGYFISDASADSIKIEIDVDNLPIVIYRDFTNILWGSTAKKWDGNKWVLLGRKGFTITHYISDFKIAPNGILYFFNTEYFDDGILYKYNNNSWEKILDLKISSCNLSLSISINKIPYIAFCDKNNNSIPKVKYLSNNNGWIDIYGFENQFYSEEIHLKFDLNDNPIIAFRDNQGNPHVNKYVNNKWINLGNIFGDNNFYSNKILIEICDNQIYTYNQYILNSGFPAKHIYHYIYSENKWEKIGAEMYSKSVDVLDMRNDNNRNMYFLYSKSGINNEIKYVLAKLK